MSSPIPTLLRNEITKAVRRKLPYFGLFALGLVCVIVYFIGGQLSNAATSNAWGYVGFSMQMVFTDMGPICLIAFAAMLVAEETGAGTIRAALAAPVQRWELYLAKAAVGMGYLLVLSVASLLFSAGLALLHYHFGVVADAGGVIYSRTQALQTLLASLALSWVPLSALVTYGLLISTLIRSPGAAVAVGVCTLFLIDFTKHLVGLDPYIFTRYIDYPWLNLQQIAQGMDCPWRPEVWRMIALCGVSAVVTFTAGLIIFVREDLNH